MKRCFIILALMFSAASVQAETYPEGYADDRAAIIDLQHRYVLAMDYFDADGYAEVFAEDGETSALDVIEKNSLLPGERLDNLLEHPDLLLGVVELLLHPLIEGTSKHRDQKFKNRTKHGLQIGKSRPKAQTAFHN